MTPLEKAARAVQETVVGCCNPNEREALEIVRAVLMAVRNDRIALMSAYLDLDLSEDTHPVATFTAMIDHILRGGE